MSYAELERKLLESATISCPDIDKSILVELYSTLRSIDWFNLFQNTSRNISALNDLITSKSELREIISAITTGMVLRNSDFRNGSPEFEELLAVIIQSLEWKCTTLFLKDPDLDNVQLDVELIKDTFRLSPDLLTMYIMSNMNFLSAGV